MFNRPDRRSAKDVNDLVYYLLGTCSIFDEDQWEQHEIEQVFDLIFCCDECGWWEEEGEGEDNICYQCINEREGELLDAEECNAECK